jgi:hypothetical protein
VQAWTDGARRELFLQQQFAGHDDVSIHRPQGRAQLASHFDSPLLRFLHGIFIANHNGRVNFLTEFQQTVVGVGPQNESDVAGREFLRDVRDPIDQETIVPEVGTRIERNGSKKNYNWLLQFIGDLDGYVQSGIVTDALGALHPVDDAVAYHWSAWRPHRDPLVLTELFDWVHVLEAQAMNMEDTDWRLPVARPVLFFRDSRWP